MGSLFAAAFGTSPFWLAPQTQVVTAYLAPGLALSLMLTTVMPRRLSYWLDPDGGPSTALFIALQAAFVCSWAASTWGFVQWRRLQASRRSELAVNPSDVARG
ncbi:MAG: hypothetical protein AB7N65_31395 [Vicinamibacterales bacterium]